jgi:SAM-dependent methyltransferase
MTARSAALQSHTPARCPRYQSARNARDWQATFASGRQVPVSVGRVRSYPGLSSAAPHTEAFYEGLAALEPSLTVLDLGSGSGHGCQLLSAHFARVSGVEVDGPALSFAREYAAGVEFILRDVAEPWGNPQADLVTVVDVLAHVERPQDALRAARSALTPGGRIVVAEPRARVGGRMFAPQRRAFSTPVLRGLLIRAGFTQVRALADCTGFVSLIAEAAQDDTGSGQLVRALDLARAGDTDAAGDAFLHCLEGEPVLAHEARLALADLALSAGQGDSAAALLVEARDAEPEDPRVWTALGRLALSARDPSTAVQCAVEGLEREACDAPAALLLAESLQVLEHPRASEAWSVASRLAPADLPVATRLARISAAENDYETGIQALMRAGEYTAVDADFRVVLGWLLLLDQRVDEAHREARVAWALSPGSPDALELLHALGEVRPGSRVEA